MYAWERLNWGRTVKSTRLGFNFSWNLSFHSGPKEIALKTRLTSGPTNEPEIDIKQRQPGDSFVYGSENTERVRQDYNLGLIKTTNNLILRSQFEREVYDQEVFFRSCNSVISAAFAYYSIFQGSKLFTQAQLAKAPTHKFVAPVIILGTGAFCLLKSLQHAFKAYGSKIDRDCIDEILDRYDGIASRRREDDEGVPLYFVDGLQKEIGHNNSMLTIKQAAFRQNLDGFTKYSIICAGYDFTNRASKRPEVAFCEIDFKSTISFWDILKG